MRLRCGRTGQKIIGERWGAWVLAAYERVALLTIEVFMQEGDEIWSWQPAEDNLDSPRGGFALVRDGQIIWSRSWHYMW